MKKRGFICLVILILYAVLCAEAQAATYYVDFENGNDNNDGLSKATAWEHSPGDPKATANANISLSAGTNVVFKGGVEYIGSIKIRSSGTASEKIIFEGNNWGEEKAIITNRNNAADATGFEAIGEKSNLVIRGFIFRDIGGYADNDSIFAQNCSNPVKSPNGGAGIKFYNGCSNITLDELDFKEIGAWQNSPPLYDITGNGIYIISANNVFISNSTFTKMNNGILLLSRALAPVSNVTIDNITISNHIVWGIDIAPVATGARLSNITIKNSYIHDIHEYDYATWKGCKSDAPHTDGIFLRNAGMGGVWENINIYGNLFEDNPLTTIGGTADIYISEGPSAEIYNNIFRSTKFTSGSIGVGGGQNTNGSSYQKVNILNNVFYDSAHISIAGDNNQSKREYRIINNIFIKKDDSSANSIFTYMSSEVMPSIMDNNLYYSNKFNESNFYVAAFAGPHYVKFAELRSLGYENHSKWADPNFESGISFKSRPNSLSIDSGMDLSSYFVLDKEGISRPQGTAWDIGAYEYVNESVISPVCRNNITENGEECDDGNLNESDGCFNNCTINNVSFVNASNRVSVDNGNTGTGGSGGSGGSGGYGSGEGQANTSTNNARDIDINTNYSFGENEEENINDEVSETIQEENINQAFNTQKPEYAKTILYGFLGMVFLAIAVVGFLVVKIIKNPNRSRAARMSRIFDS